jgi:cAMP-dependent protein kinase regulator
MSLHPDYEIEINALNREILKSEPTDILQFCSNYFNRRLESQRAEFILSRLHTTAYPSSSPGNKVMAESSFPGFAGANSNPFGSSGGANPFGSQPSAAGGGGIHSLQEEEENDVLSSPTSPTFKQNSFSGGPDITQRGVPIPGARASALSAGMSSTPPSAFKASSPGGEGFPTNYGFGRRTSVSAESMNPTSSLSDNWTPPHHAKTQDQLSRLKTAISGNFLFSHLDEEQTSQVLGALVEKPIPAKDIKVITQGDVGDYFYVVEKGDFEIYVGTGAGFKPGPEGLGNKVSTIGPGGSFGELALMYNAPRAATVVSLEPSTLWALDRVTFRRILMENTFQRRRMYESFLEEVPLLSSLTPYERSKIADALNTETYPAGHSIIEEGAAGEAFFILESGEADVFKKGNPEPVNSYKKGDYFGELALLNDAPRAASVVSRNKVKVATLGKAGFQRLLGPVEGIMRRNDPSKASIDDANAVDPLHKG